MDRWRKVERWEGTWEAVNHVRWSGPSSAGWVTKIGSGHVVLDRVTRTETLPGEKTPGWSGATVWTGKCKAQVSIRSQSSQWGPKGQFFQRVTSEGSGPTEIDAELAIGAVKDFVHGDFGSPSIDVSVSVEKPESSYTRTDRDWIDINRMANRGASNPDDRPFWGKLPEKGRILRGEYSGRRDGTTGDAPVVHTSHVSWAFWPSQEVDLVVDVAGYEDWLPRGDLSDARKAGNHLDVRATLETRGTGQPSTTRKLESVVFELVNVSREPGVCMNAPLSTVVPGGEVDDLFFERSEQAASGGDVLPGEPRLVVPTQGANTARAAVHSRDFGAYGVLRVTGILEGGTAEIVGHVRGDDSKTEVRIPLSDPGSVVAKSWKRQKKVADWDDDADREMVGGWLYPGDGLSLYEEYRGFSVRGDHKRTEPARKTLFVHTKMSAADGGLRVLSRASGIQVLRIDRDEYRSNKERLVNFNHGAHHVVDQHGVWLVERRIPTGIGGWSFLGPPRFIDRVEVTPDYVTWDRTFRDGLIAHELCHAIGVDHHGDGDFEMTFEPGAVPSLPKGGTVSIAVQQGEHSGVQECLMRYCEATDLVETMVGGKKVLVAYGPSEPHGLILCTTDEGTGVNDPHRPGRKCGPAQPGRGICLSRPRVSDVHPQAGR
jgi:hypothetical protein